MIEILSLGGGCEPLPPFQKKKLAPPSEVARQIFAGARGRFFYPSQTNRENYEQGRRLLSSGF
jgi:hypothetical protein